MTKDSVIFDIIQREKERQIKGIELIASEIDRVIVAEAPQSPAYIFNCVLTHDIAEGEDLYLRHSVKPTSYILAVTAIISHIDRFVNFTMHQKPLTNPLTSAEQISPPTTLLRYTSIVA